MINLDNNVSKLTGEVKSGSGINFSACLHCQSCTNGCPFLEAMDYAPNVVVRLVQLGQEEQVLQSSTIWICVGCNTCSSSCPMAIDMPGIMDNLRQRAIKKGVKIAEPGVLCFHEELLNTVKKYGRTHKLELMMKYKLKRMDLFSDMGVGIKMLTKRKLDLLPSKVRNKKAIAEIFKKK